MSASGQARTGGSLSETVIGAIVVLVAVVLLALGYLHGTSGGLSGYEITARLAKVDGLGVGTDVRLAGIKVGSVSDLTLDPKTYLVTVHMHIRNEIKIPEDSSILVTSSGLLGTPYLSITPGGDEHVLTAGGAIENAQGSVDVMGLMGRFVNGEGK